jgi:hypothetical protein
LPAHFRYISKNGPLSFEDDRGAAREGKEALHDLAEQWQFGGATGRPGVLELLIALPETCCLKPAIRLGSPNG